MRTATGPAGGNPKSTRHPWRRIRGRYHHGNLRAAALEAGRRIIARGGATALTLRGLARELGVTAPALLYHFGRRDQLVAAIAAEADDDLCEAIAGVAELETLGLKWTGWARDNIQLYRLLAITVPTMNPMVACRPAAQRRLLRRLDSMVARDARRQRRPAPDPAAAGAVYVGLHGIAALSGEEAREGAVAALLRGLAAPLAWPVATAPG